jgi:hypothetical protein
MLENTLISIEIIDGVKYIHYSGFGYYNGEPNDKPYRWVDYTWLMCPLKEALEYGISKWEEDNQEFVTQYIEDLSGYEIERIFEHHNHDILKENEINENINCGIYWYVAD